MTEPSASYYSAAHSYKTPAKHRLYPTRPKHSAPHHTETPQRYQEAAAKSSRNRDYVSSVANKDRCKTEQEEENNVGYTDEELGNFTEDNLENDVEDGEGMRDKIRFINLIFFYS